MSDQQDPFTEAAGRAMEYLESHPGVDFRFRLHEVTETVPSYITGFAPMNPAASQICALMQECLPNKPFAAREELTAAFNILVDRATERCFTTEAKDMTITIRAAKTIPVMRPLSLKRRG